MTIFGDVIRSGAARGRRRPEVTTPTDSAWPIYFCKFFELRVYLFPFRSYSAFSFRLGSNSLLRVLFYVFSEN
jgi:hypothetical protein